MGQWGLVPSQEGAEGEDRILPLWNRECHDHQTLPLEVRFPVVSVLIGDYPVCESDAL